MKRRIMKGRLITDPIKRKEAVEDAEDEFEVEVMLLPTEEDEEQENIANEHLA